VVGGWDISSFDLGAAMERAKVLEPDLKRQVYDEMAQLKPLPSIYYRDFMIVVWTANTERFADLIDG